RRQRLADIGDSCRNYSGDRSKDAALAEMALHLTEAAAELLDEFVEGLELNRGLGDFRLQRDNAFARRGRIGFDPDASPPPLNTTVDVRMHYTAFSAHVTGVLLRMFGLYGN